MKLSQSLSLVIPLYNEEFLVKSAIEDCLTKLDADFENYELILIDDGSRDNTVKIINEHFANHPKIVFDQNYVNLNQGVSVQRGFKMASNEFVVFNGIDLPLDIKELRTILESEKDFDVLVLERKIYSGATQWRLITSNVNILIRKILYPNLTAPFKDMNFTQIYRQDILEQIMPLAKSPAFTTPELIMRAKINGLRVKTRAMTFNERTHGTGSLGKLHDILWTIYDMLRFRYLLWIGLETHGKVK
jgi:glycosyltransferase involved in cell wall biosynthesis